jgi:hypothetical protein
MAHRWPVTEKIFCGMRLTLFFTGKEPCIEEMYVSDDLKKGTLSTDDEFHNIFAVEASRGKGKGTVEEKILLSI